MPLYYFGEDSFHCVTNCGNQKDLLRPFQIASPEADFQMTWDHIVFKKVTNSWFIKGFGIAPDFELFPSELDVSTLCLTDSTVLGLCSADGSLYTSAITVSSTNNGTKTCSKPSRINSNCNKITQIVSSLKDFYCVDDINNVYKVVDYKLIKLFNAEGIVIRKIACGYSHFVILSDTGALYSFGNGSRGQLGCEDRVVLCDVTYPERILFFDDLPSVVTDVVCGGWHTLALTSDGDVYSWGWNENGGLGHAKNTEGTVVATPFPIDIGSAQDPVISIAAGSRHSLLLLKSGKIFSFGYNKYGQLGLGDNIDRAEPCEIVYDLIGTACSIMCTKWGSFVRTRTD